MHAWIVERPRPVAEQPLRLEELPDPEPGPGEVRVRVSACGVCRTDLHVTEGDLPPHRQPVVPGHEVIGYVDRCGPGATRFRLGDRIGIAWLRHTCGVCRFCQRGAENLCVDPRFTGWDEHGGYAEFAVVNESYAYFVPATFPDLTAAPLLCAGIIGYRALQRAEVPAGGRLGIWGFGGSAHLTAQLALARGAEIHVRTRGRKGQNLAAELGASTVGDSTDPLPKPLDAAIVFAPAGELVPIALSALDRGGTLAVAGIHLSDIPRLNYQQHLFQERTLRSVTANTRSDGTAFLEEATRTPVTVAVVPYAFEDAPVALRDLAEDRVRGAAVLTVDI